VTVIGSCFYQSEGDDARRQRRAREALLGLGGVTPVNLQFRDDSYRPDGLRTLAVLRQNSRTITRTSGRRKPIVSEMLDALAAEASAGGSRYFAYVNADIEVTREAIDRIHGSGRGALSFCRVDVDAGTRAAPAVQLNGIDMIAIETVWWIRERRRFRPYIAGEACWDNVYAAILCSHARGEIVHHAPGIFHERHETSWHAGPFADYNGFLAALDAPYFTRWVTWVSRVREQREAGVPADSEALLAEVFNGPLLSLAGRMRHVGRQARAHYRYRRLRAQFGRGSSA